MIGFENTTDNGHKSVDAVNGTLPKQLRLVLNVQDPEVIQEIHKHPEGTGREEFSLAALRLGVLSFRQANGLVDSQAIREEGLKLVATVGEMLAGYSKGFLGAMTTSLTQYFDPANGDLPQRLDRLMKKDGDLESLLNRHMQGEACSLAQTLAKHVGEQSPLFQMLSPTQSNGILAALREVVQGGLDLQREHILRQFSLDEEGSALSRLVGELTEANGQLKTDLAGDLNKIRSEFSLDNEQGALSRLVGRVEKAQRTIVDQFSQDNEQSALSRLAKLLEKTNSKVEGCLTLDDEKSPLSRLRRELLQVIDSLSKTNGEFQTEVRATLEAFKARRDEAARSTTHGGDFQDSVGSVLQLEAQRLGDVFEGTGSKTGSKAYCRKGDFANVLGPESAGAGGRIVIEAKEDKTFDVTKALVEMHEARENREAQAGIFVFSKTTAPPGIEVLSRYGSDILVIWDRDDVATDIILKAAFSLARALVVRERVAKEQTQADFNEIDRALARIAKDTEDLGQVTTWATTIQNNGKKILDKIGRIQEDLEKQLELLGDHLNGFRDSASTPVAAAAVVAE
jgi:hypothetical protein